MSPAEQFAAAIITAKHWSTSQLLAFFYPDCCILLLRLSSAGPRHSNVVRGSRPHAAAGKELQETHGEAQGHLPLDILRYMSNCNTAVELRFSAASWLHAAAVTRLGRGSVRAGGGGGGEGGGGCLVQGD